MKTTVVATVAALSLVTTKPAAAGAGHGAPYFDTCKTGGDELFIDIRDADGADYSETQMSSLDFSLYVESLVDTAFVFVDEWEFSSVGSSKTNNLNCDFLVDSESGGGSTPIDLGANTLYRITIKKGGNEAFSFMYAGCVASVPSSMRFYCPTEGGHSAGTTRNDVLITWLDGSSTAAVNVYAVDYDDVNIAADLGDNFMLPHDMYAFCDNQSLLDGVTCMGGTGGFYVSVFLTFQTDPFEFEHRAGDLVIGKNPPYWSESWDLGSTAAERVTLKMQSVTSVVVQSSFGMQNVALLPAVTSWSGIDFESQSSGAIESSTISGVSDGYSIEIASASPTITGSELNSIYVTGTSSGPVITGNTLSGGMTFYNAGGTVADNTMKWFHTGMYADPNLDSGSPAGGNLISGSSNWGLAAEEASSISLASSSNCVWNHPGLDAWAMDDSDIWAQAVWWDSMTPNVDWDETSTVDFEEPLSSCPGLASKSSPPVAADAAIDDDLLSRLGRAKALRRAGLSAEAAGELRAIVGEAPASKEAGLALIELGRMMRRTRDPQLADFVGEFAAPGQKGRATLSGLLMDYHRGRGEDRQADEIASMVEREFPGSWQAFYVQWQTLEGLLQTGAILEAEDVLARMQPVSEGQKEVWDRLAARLGSIAGKAGAGERLSADSGTSASGASVEVSAYPNPFNPVASVRVVLPAEGDVRVLVYDVLGRQVALLAEERLPAGLHRFSWDATGFPSGTYFLAVRAGAFNKTVPLTLMK